ncbi:MAG TPA: hypothetical protein VGD22_17135 [Sphingobacteriaceae bacterium]
MINRLLPILGIASLVVLGSCSTSKLIQNDVNDDVYYSVAQAKEAVPVVYQEKTHVTERDVYADEDSYSGYYDDYSVRINRFYRYSPWRNYYDSYYDPFYSYSPYGYNRYSPGVRVNVYIGGGYYGYNPYWNNNYWGYYGYPYRHNYWGMHSYYNTYPYYGGYYGNNGYYYGGMGRDAQSSPNYRPRPVRDFDNISNGTRRPTSPGGSGAIRDNSGVITDTRSRTERYNDGNRVTPSSTTGSRTSSTRPSRTETERPARTSSVPQRTSDDSRTYTRPTRIEPSTPSPSYDSGSSSSGRGDSGSSSGSSSSGRPSRGN